MILLCPHCGHHLSQPLLNGITSCSNCRRVFDSSHRNKLLSAAWLVRKHDIYSTDWLIEQYHYEPDDAAFVIKFVAEECYSHEEFLALLNERLS